MNSNYYGVIMAGGIGSRFWPMSRTTYPKQFLDILGTGETLLQQTFNRLTALCPAENIIVVTNEQYQGLVQKQLPKMNVSQILAEPARRNTAPCIAYAAYKIKELNPNGVMLVAPSDHLITDQQAFIATATEGMEMAANNDLLVTLGIEPSRPDTGYGYIQYLTDQFEDSKLRKVKTFTEKPDLEMAKQFLDSGDFLWNSGIFIWSIPSIMKAFAELMPETTANFDELAGYFGQPEERDQLHLLYPACKNISIDYGIMEKAENVYVIPSSFGWSDLGTWGSLYEHKDHDANANALQGKNILTYDCKENIVNISSDKLVVLQGLEGYIVVEKDNVLLVCKKDEEQEIKQIVADVKLEKGPDYV